MSTRLVVTEGVVAGNPYDKYGTRNPIARRLMAGFLRGLDSLLDRILDPRAVLEVGCGEGHISARLAARFPAAELLATDFSPEILAVARAAHPGLRFEPLSVYDAPALGRRFDLAVACEVFEHLESPAEALEALRAVSREWLLLTVPREPVWRMLNMARGRYLSRLGNSHGHIQHWSRAGFIAFLERQVEVVAWRAPLPWTQVLCRLPGSRTH
jgi:2-polyprenyl-3-methyl-5-hydroxy-6-metoxy-1,4-benzoquinol methylase